MRWGYRPLWLLLRREGYVVNHKRVDRQHRRRLHALPAHGSYSLHSEGTADARIQALWDFERSPVFEERERVAFRFARDAALAPNATTAEHHAALRKHYSAVEIAEILAVISLAGWLNRWNDSLATVTDEESASWAEEHLAAVGWERGRHAPEPPTR